MTGFGQSLKAFPGALLIRLSTVNNPLTQKNTSTLLSQISPCPFFQRGGNRDSPFSKRGTKGDLFSETIARLRLESFVKFGLS